MKIFLKSKSMQVLSVSLLALASQNLQAVRINGQEVDFENFSHVRAKITLEDVSSVLFQIEGDQIKTSRLIPDEVIISEWNKSYVDTLLFNMRFGSRHISGGPFTSKVGGLISNHGTYVRAGTKIELTAGDNISQISTTLEAKEAVTLTSPKIKVDNLFVSTPSEVRFLAPEGSPSWLAGFSFSAIPSDKRLFSLGFDGLINFNNLDETSGDDAFLAVGTNTVTFYLKKIQDNSDESVKLQEQNGKPGREDEIKN